MPPEEHDTVILARASLRRLIELRLPPTPENYGRLYDEFAAALARQARSASGTLRSNPGRGEAESPLVARADTSARSAPAEHQHVKPGEPPLQGTLEPASEQASQLIFKVERLVEQAATTTTRLGEDLETERARLQEGIALLGPHRLPSEVSAHIDEIRAATADIRDAVQTSQIELLQARRELTLLRSEVAEARALVGQDPLTGATNRRGMDLALEREMARARRHNEPLSVVMLDVDHFKQINDTHGHSAGDAALVHLTQIARESLRGGDTLVRYGGEEFLLVLPQTGVKGAEYIAHKLQTLLQRSPLAYGSVSITLTLSGGVAELEAADTMSSLINRADQALLRAKRAGRNRVMLAKD